MTKQSEILQNEPRLDKYLCAVLMTELLFGVGKLRGESKPVQTILSYEKKFRDILEELTQNGQISSSPSDTKGNY